MDSTPLTYNITMFKDSLTKSVFSKTFVVSGAPLPLELISGGYVNQTRAYGPDFSSSGAYHLEAPFLKGNANYTIKVEIADNKRQTTAEQNNRRFQFENSDIISFNFLGQVQERAR